MFTTYPSYDPFRPLKLEDPRLRGEDVYALQTALNALGATLTEDGILGPMTATAIKGVQKALGITADGSVGPVTWAQITDRLLVPHVEDQGLPQGLAHGGAFLESGLRGGTYSRPQRADGSYDAGVVQRNTNFTPPREGFDMPDSLHVYCSTLRVAFDRYKGVADKRRRWGLAAGSWNAPAFANWLAKQEGALAPGPTSKPSDAARAKLEDYIANATKFLVL